MTPDDGELTLNEYQEAAGQTDQFKQGQDNESISNSISNLMEEVGALLRWHQQDLQEGGELRQFKDRAPRKLGDILWHLSSIATRTGVSLEEIAREQLTRAGHRWPESDAYRLFDEDFPPEQQLPRKCEFYMKERPDGKVVTWVETGIGPWFMGDPVDDNAHEDDGYRFHDVLHLSYAAYLGWSPVMRALLRRKRKADAKIDVVEDGARARDLEEALTAFIYEHAKTEDLFEGKDRIDFKIIKQAERLTMSREVRTRSPEHWQEAILKGYEVFRQVLAKRGGVVEVDLIERTMIFRELPPNA